MDPWINGSAAGTAARAAAGAAASAAAVCIHYVLSFTNRIGPLKIRSFRARPATRAKLFPAGRQARPATRAK